MDTSRKTNALVLASLSLSTLLSSLGTSSANVALPRLAEAFGSSFREVQWVVLAYLLAMTMLIVIVGRLGDVIGRRRLLLAGLLLFALASALCAAAPTLSLLIAARAVQGLGAAAMMALAMALVGETIGREKTGSAMGLLGTMSAIGTALGPSLGGALHAGFGWRAIFLVNLPLGLLGFFLASRSLPARPAAATAQRAFDPAGMMLLAVTLGAYALAMTEANVALLLVALAGAVLFIRVEARTAAPLVRLAMFRSRTISAGFGMSALVTTVVMATLIVGPFYLSAALGLAPAAVGAVMSVGPVVAALAGVPAGRLVDRFGAQPASVAGLIAMALGCGGLSLIPAALGVSGYVVPLAIVTAGYALFQAANNTAVMAGIAQSERGVVSGLLNLSRNLGLITGASAMGMVFGLAKDAQAGMHLTFAVAAALVAAALLAALSHQAGDPQHAAAGKKP
jgi:EmrB/QacA subfamily drug resistance transporter